ncbi:MAG: hypothetical protein IKO10_06955 [Lachnospiraceae bacterium]|nr:hypothetical protein [Lachnospiraceae bacterium]
MEKIIGIFAALILVTVGAAFLITGFTRRIGSPMKRGEDAMVEKNYTLAVASYREALQQDPKNVKAYEEGIVAAYEAQGDNDAALHMLEKGYENTSDASLETRMNTLRDSIGPVVLSGGSGTLQNPELGVGETVRQRQVELLEKAYDLLSKQDYDGMCSVDGSSEADQVIAELKGDHVIYIPEDGSHGTGTGCGVYQVSGGYFFYYGDFVDGERVGHGVSYWYNGSGYETYEGEWKDDMPNGNGTEHLYYDYGRSVYRTGNFRDGVEDGDFRILIEDSYSGDSQSGEYYVSYGRPTEATDELDQIYQEVEDDLAAGRTVDYQKQILHDDYEYANMYGDEIIYVIYDDYNYETYYRYSDLLGALGYR